MRLKIQPEQGLREVKHEGDWEVIPVKLDTGACDWVFTTEAARAFPLIETPNSATGVSYQGANGSEIVNHGEILVNGFTGDYVPMSVGAQIVEVQRKQASGFKIISADNRIILDDEGSIQNKSSGRHNQHSQP